MLHLSRLISLLLALTLQAGLTACGSPPPEAPETGETSGQEQTVPEESGEEGPQQSAPSSADGWVTRGTETDRGFVLDNVLHSETEGDIHFNLYVPDTYDGSRPVAVFFTLPGYEGLYFQGVGANLQEDFAFEAMAYDGDMIIVAPSSATGGRPPPGRPSRWRSTSWRAITLTGTGSMPTATPAAGRPCPR